MNRIGPLTISVILLTMSIQFLGVPLTGSDHISSPSHHQNSPAGTNPYVTTFPIWKNISDFLPFVLYPADNQTVWVVTIKGGNTVGKTHVPPYAQIVNFTLGAGGKPIVTTVITLRNAIPSDIVYDHILSRAWFLENNSLADYNSLAPGSIHLDQTFRRCS